MKHFYQNIQGWFDFMELYKEQVERVGSGHFVEAGGYKGKSACFMGVEIVNSGKSILFDVVDLWKENYEEFLENINEVPGIIDHIRGESIRVAELYENESLDFVFIDGNHIYEAVKADINAWFPKIKKGGVLAGHDYQFPGVRRAVDEFNHVIQIGTSWKYEN